MGRAPGRVGCACPYIMPHGVSFTPICLNAKCIRASAACLVNILFVCAGADLLRQYVEDSNNLLFQRQHNLLVFVEHIPFEFQQDQM